MESARLAKHCSTSASLLLVILLCLLISTQSQALTPSAQSAPDELSLLEPLADDDPVKNIPPALHTPSVVTAVKTAFTTTHARQLRFRATGNYSPNPTRAPPLSPGIQSLH